jgi:hypothetical protein
MRILRVVALAWLLTDCGAVAGWELGRLFDAPFLGAIVVGTLAILLAIRILATIGWLDPDRRRGGSIGGLCGFALAAAFAAMNVDQPLVPLLVLGFVGLSVIAGAGPSAAR